MAACRDALWDAAFNAGWNDNVTIGLCRIVSGCKQDISSQNESVPTQKKTSKRRIKKAITGLILGIIIAGIIAGIAIIKFFK